MVSLFLWLGWVPLCGWTIFVIAQLVASFRSASPLTASGQAPRCIVFIPAHNEAHGLGDALARLTSELPPSFELIVLADNCTDETATIAARAGATVWERHHPTERGKGYALRHGMRELRRWRPYTECVVFLDADTFASQATLRALADTAVTHRAPVQVPHFYPAPGNDAGASALSELGSWWSVTVRERGRAALGLPHFLHGTGMAVPFFLLSHFEHLTDSAVEDKTLTVHFAISRHAPLYLFSHSVRFPRRQLGWRVRRARWERGHLRETLRLFPKLLFLAFQKRQATLLWFAIDFSTPPLFLLLAADLLWLSFYLTKFGYRPVPTPTALLAGAVIGLVAAMLTRFLFSPYAPYFRTYCVALPAYFGGKMKNYLGFSTIGVWQK